MGRLLGRTLEVPHGGHDILAAAALLRDDYETFPSDSLIIRQLQRQREELHIKAQLSRQSFLDHSM